MATLSLVLLLGGGVPSAFAAEVVLSPVWCDVRSFGAVGDGKTDDTAAFEQAIAEGARQLIPVYVPRATYRLTRTLEIEAQLLLGQIAGGWPSDAMPMPTLLIDHAEGPGLRMKQGASVHGIAFLYPTEPRGTGVSPVTEVAGTPGPAIAIAGQGLSITNVRIQYPYDAILTEPGAPAGRTNIENVFIVAPRHDGVHITKSYDITTLRNIEVWCNGGMSSGAGFRFGRNDEVACTNLFAFQCQVGFAFDLDKEQGGGSTYGSFTNCATDACSIGYQITSPANINVANSDLVDHHMSLDIKDPGASVRLTGCRLQSNGAPAILVDGCSSLIVTGCFFGGAFVNEAKTFVEIANAKRVTLYANQFDATGAGIHLAQSVGKAVVMGNLFAESPFSKLKVEMKEGTWETGGNVGE